MSNIRIYEKNEVEYARLKAFADACNASFGSSLYEVTLKNIYFDYGQEWFYTSPVTVDLDEEDEWQSLCPRDYEIIINCDSFTDIQRYADYYANAVMNGDICVDIYKIV